MNNETNRAAPAAAQLDADLPPLDEAWAANVIGLGGELSSQSKERVACVLSGARAVVAPYAERIRLLTEELAKDRAAWLAEMKADAELDRQIAASRMQQPAQSSGPRCMGMDCVCNGWCIAGQPGPSKESSK